MATNKEVLAQAKKDPRYRLDLLKELMRIAVAEDPDILTKAQLNMEAKKNK